MRNLICSVVFYSKFAAVSFFKKNSRDLFRETNFFSQEEATFSSFLEIFLIQLHHSTNFSFLADFKNVNLFLKTHIFDLTKPIFLNVLGSFTFSVAFYRKVATFGDFSKKKQYFFRKTNHTFPSKNLNLERFQNF